MSQSLSARRSAYLDALTQRIERKLQKVAETRFTSNTIVLRRLVAVREALSSMVISQQWNIWRQSSSEMATNIRTRILDETWWSRAEYLLSFTEPILSMIRFTDMDKPCLGEVYDGIDSMIENMRSVINAREQDPEETFCKEVQSICVERWNKMTTPLHLLVFALSPKYYSEEILALPTRVPPYRDAEVGEGCRKAIAKLFPNIEMEDVVTSEFVDFVSSTGQTLAAVRDKYRKDAHAWWYLNGHKLPNLQILAIKVLSQVASSSSAERNWSTYSFIHSLKRNRLALGKVEDLVYVHSNLRLLTHKTDDYKQGAAKLWDVEPDSIDLDLPIGAPNTPMEDLSSQHILTASTSGIQSSNVNVNDNLDDDDDPYGEDEAERALLNGNQDMGHYLSSLFDCQALDSPSQRPDLLQELFTDVVLEVDSRAQAILFDDKEDVINSAEYGRFPCFYEVLAERYVQMPENGEPVLRLIVQLWSQSFASQIFSLLFYKWLFDLPPENLEVPLRYASAFVQGATNIFWIDVQSNTRRFFSLFHYIFEEVALVPRRLNKIPIQAQRELFMLLSRFLFFYEPEERLEILLNHFPPFPNTFLVGGPEDFFVIELTDQLQKLKVEPVLLHYLKCMRVLQAKEIRMTTSTRLKSCLYSFTSPGGPMYPTRAVRHAAWGTLDLLFPVGRYPRHLISIFFRLLHPYYWPSSCWNFIITCVKALLCAMWMTLYKLYERVIGEQTNLRNRR